MEDSYMPIQRRGRQNPEKTDTGELSWFRKLSRPDHKVDVVIDTDTYNEIDDQYALAYLIKSSEKLSLQAIYAAPFWNEKSDSPEDGMKKSYQEIHNILTLMGRDDLKKLVYRGASGYLRSETVPESSEAARDLVSRAMEYPEDEPLYVVAIGAITNIASAILMKPAIIRRIVVVWLGGNAINWPHNEEFNMKQDVAAARVVMGCGVPLVILPCMGVVSSFTISGPEVDYHLRGHNPLCDYLADYTKREGERTSHLSTWTRVIWDVTAVGWLLDGNFMDDCLIHSPIPEYDHRYSFDPRRHMIRYVYHINRDELFADLFAKLTS